MGSLRLNNKYYKRREETIVKKLQAIGRKMSAGILTVCLTVGMLAGTFTSGTAEQVSGAITGFTSNDFLKCYGTSTYHLQHLR